MTMMATACGVCHSPLVLDREHWDKIDGLFVGELTCPRCGRHYLDTRRRYELRPGQTTASTSTLNSTTKGPTMRLFDVDTVGIYLDTYSPRGEKTTEGETEVLDLTLRVQPFTIELAVAFDERVRAKLWTRSDATQDPIIAELKLRNIDPPKQDVSVFFLPEHKRARIAFLDVECSDFRVRAEKGVDGYALVFYATVGPLGASELEEIYKWHRQQRFLTFNKSQSVLNFEAKDADKVESEPPRHRKAKGNGADAPQSPP